MTYIHFFAYNASRNPIRIDKIIPELPQTIKHSRILTSHEFLYTKSETNSNMIFFRSLYLLKSS